MWNGMSRLLLEALGEPQIVLIVMLALFCIVLFYKETKSSSNQYANNLLVRLDKTLELYGALETRMLIHLRTKSSQTEKELMELIGSTYPYVSQDVHDALAQYLRYRDLESLDICVGLIQKETPLLRKKYEGHVPDLHDSLEGAMRTFHILGKALGPTLFTLGALAIVVGFVMGMTAISHEPSRDRQIAMEFDLGMGAFVGLYFYFMYKDRAFWKGTNWLAKVLPFLCLSYILPETWYMKLVFFLASIIIVFFANWVLYIRKRSPQRGDANNKGIYF